jgi:hypothetical protein
MSGADDELPVQNSVSDPVPQVGEDEQQKI